VVWFSSSQTSNGILWSKLHKQVIVEIEEGDLKMASIMVGLLVFWSRILCPFVQKGQICLVSVISGHWISIHNLSNSKCRNPCIGLFRSSCRVFYSAAGMMGVKWASRFALTGTCLRNQRSTTCNSLIYEKRLLTTCVIIYMHSHTRFLISMDYTGCGCSNSCENGKDIEALRKKWQMMTWPLQFFVRRPKVSWWNDCLLMKNNSDFIYSVVIFVYEWR
jgi:hypothetical protein